MRDQIDDIFDFCAEFEKGGWRDLHLKLDDFELFISSDADSPGLQSSGDGEEEPLVQSDLADPLATTYRAPNLGTFMRRAEATGAQFVREGDNVEAGADLYALRVLQSVTIIKAETGGIVAKIHVEDGALVEFDQPLISIERRET